VRCTSKRFNVFNNDTQKQYKIGLHKILLFRST